jgi:PAS domain-containing protein
LQLRNVPPLPQRWEAVFPPALLRELEPLMQAVAAGSREQRLTWKERTLQLEAASDLTADGHKLMIVHDISRYQAAVQAMQHTEERWRRALEVSGDGVGTVSASRCRIFIRPSAGNLRLRPRRSGKRSGRTGPPHPS